LVPALTWLAAAFYLYGGDETANILHNASERSFGADGRSGCVARAPSMACHWPGQQQAKLAKLYYTLFATHCFELTVLPEKPANRG
jgi:hypothetical protein